MNVIYATASHLGGTGLSNVAFHASHALYKSGNLKKIITYKNRQSEIPRHLIKRVIFQPAKVFSGLSSRYYYSMKRMWLDYRAADYLSHHDCDIFHGWTHESLRCLRVAKARGILSVIDRGYSHPKFSKRILDEEFAIYGLPQGAAKVPGWLRPFDHLRREQEEACEEFDTADYVFVNSPFCYETFVNEGYPKEKLVMLPRGFNPAIYKPVAQPDTVFRAIFVGQLLVRKGLKYLLEAWARLNLPNAELLLVGNLMDEARPAVEPYLSRPDVRHIGFVPDPVAAYNSATVFVFPSVDEGSAKVTYEAMACELPVIVTPNAGSLAVDGEDGFIVPIRSVDALMEKILFFYEHRDAAREMGKTARRHIESYTWDVYEANLIATYRRLLAHK
ncbi:glycosyltransferase family 4 protein [Candidatus Kaiserbacteria bacterium]|nr:glycosyltransferase family 4 protein [Candidatus Kaiserbacteria bacterium]